jgi:adenosylcobyric acid synthase
MTAAALMLQGTGSDVGKSLLVAGLCRAFTRRGLAVRPFKPQNMSNNAAVTVDGGEIGRAQALQARACGTPPTIEMNPVLLKPQGETGAQLIVRGRVAGTATAREYLRLRRGLMPRVLESFHRLAREADLVLVEGAGSAAEVNLRDGDIANMGFAEAADLPVVLVGDIERGGVIAQLVGTHLLLSEVERRRLAGFIVNKFRGDPRLFDSGIAEITARTGLASFGVVPWFEGAERLPAEDSLDLSRYRGNGARAIKIAVLAYPRIANFDDLDPLAAEPDVTLALVRAGEAVPGDADLVILPGSKATLADLRFLRAQGWDIDILAHRRRRGAVLGICAGYQMLGTRVADPSGIEGPPGEASGLALLDVETLLEGDKRLVEVRGRADFADATVHGYEMHIGGTTGSATNAPMLRLEGGPDGAISADGRVMGCYVHGLFADDEFRHRFLDRLRPRAAQGIVFEAEIEAALDSLAAHLERNLDLDRALATASRIVLRPPSTTLPREGEGDFVGAAASIFPSPIEGERREGGSNVGRFE